MKILTFGFLCLITASAFGKTKTDLVNIVELKELNLSVLVSCGAPANKQNPNIFVLAVDGSPYENSRAEEFSFRFDEKKKEDSKYIIKDAKTVWLKLDNKEEIRIGTLEKSVMDDFNSQDCTISKNHFPAEGRYIAHIDQQYKYLINVEDVKNYCDANSKILEEASLSGKKTVKANYIVLDQKSEKVVAKGVMREFSKEVCATGITVAKGIADQIGAILYIPMAIIVALLGGFA